MAFMALQAPGDDSAHLIYEFERRAYPVRNSLLTIGRDAASRKKKDSRTLGAPSQAGAQGSFHRGKV